MKIQVFDCSHLERELEKIKGKNEKLRQAIEHEIVKKQTKKLKTA